MCLLYVHVCIYNNHYFVSLSQIIFAPRMPGPYVGQLHVSVQPMVSDQASLYTDLDRLPSVVSLVGIAEKPLVQVC